MTKLRGMEYGVLHLVASDVPVSVNEPLLTYLERSGVNDPELLIRLGSVYVNELRTEDVTTMLKRDDSVRVHSTPRRYPKPENLKSRILEQAKSYYLIDKPAGIPVHSQVDNSQENLLAFLEDELGENLFITHRLDTPTSGCLLIARSLEAQRQINKLFRDRLINKNYVAQIERAVEPKLYSHYMKPSFKSPKEISNQKLEGWLGCELIVTECKKSDNIFTAQIKLLTGRPQQIRAQLAFLGAPILGDTNYGSQISLAPNTIALRCTNLDFDKELL